MIRWERRQNPLSPHRHQHLHVSPPGSLAGTNFPVYNGVAHPMNEGPRCTLGSGLDEGSPCGRHSHPDRRNSFGVELLLPRTQRRLAGSSPTLGLSPHPLRGRASADSPKPVGSPPSPRGCCPGLHIFFNTFRYCSPWHHGHAGEVDGEERAFAGFTLQCNGSAH